MANSVEPPILLSRLMAFVFAALAVVVVVLIITVAKMFPLDKTQVFFLETEPRENMEIRLSSFSPDNQNLETYKQAFIKEYIKARNEVIPSPSQMQRKWSATNEGSVYSWSAPDVYKQFANTAMYIALMNDIPDFEFRCPVEFHGGLAPRGPDKYAVRFSYFCTDNNSGQECKKDYTIAIKLELEDKVKWSERLRNPLGIRVVEYKLESGDGDPLETGFLCDFAE
ncbi:MAG: type IV secretion system protein [Rickettsiales bacterium]|nr:type IV secretion system protein [Rickettsiales bacterium]